VVRAAALVRDDPRIQVAIIGTGPVEGELKALARELGAQNVRFIPFRPYSDMPRINALADALLVHLRDYPFMSVTIPSKTQVALASGRPMLVGLRGDAADLVRQAGAGVVVPPDDPGAMAEGMRRLASASPDELAAMGRGGRQYYLDHLSLEVAGNQMDEIFRAVARRRGNPPATVPSLAEG
jgi:glycosyltransferase involved in cell wall biosynthesis